MLSDFRQSSLIINASNSLGAGEKGPEAFAKSLDEAKQAILRWVADEVIGEDEEETIEDKLGGKYRFNSNKRRRNIVKRNQRKILAQHGYKGDQR